MAFVCCLRFSILLAVGTSLCAYFLLWRSSHVAIFDSLQQYQGADLPLFGALVNKNNLSNKVTDKNDETKKWIVLLEVNNGYYDILQNWLVHFYNLRLRNKVVIVALDDAVKKNIEKDVISKHSSQFSVVGSMHPSINAALKYDSPEYKKLVSGRASNILSMLEKGVNVIYSDVDTIWRSNPLPYVTGRNDTDLILSVDSKQARGFKPYYCTGFMAIVSNNRTISFINEWKHALDRQPQLNQPIFNELLYKQSNVKHEPLPIQEFPSGDLYFNQFSDAQRQEAVVVHANYMIGHESRKSSFQKHHLWMLNDTETSSPPVRLFPVQLVHNNTANERVYTAKLDPNDNIQSQIKTKRPIFAIIASTRSRPEWKLVSETPLQMHLIQSTARSITPDEVLTWDIHLYVAVDDDDVFWVHDDNISNLRIPSWMTLTFAIVPRVPNHIPFNEIAQVAYKNDAEYYCRVNDDSSFYTFGWITQGVTALRQFDPPNVGVVGPTCPDGKTSILTHDMVHKTHMEIFHQLYYPPQFHNWFLDDWITFQYQKRTIGVDLYMKLENWVVRHRSTLKRYVHDYKDGKLLPAALDSGRRDILRYLQEHFPNHSATLAVENVERRYNATQHHDYGKLY